MAKKSYKGTMRNRCFGGPMNGKTIRSGFGSDCIHFDANGKQLRCEQAHGTGLSAASYIKEVAKDGLNCWVYVQPTSKKGAK